MSRLLQGSGRENWFKSFSAATLIQERAFEAPARKLTLKMRLGSAGCANDGLVSPSNRWACLLAPWLAYGSGKTSDDETDWITPQAQTLRDAG